MSKSHMNNQQVLDNRPYEEAAGEHHDVADFS